jgi:hypothetical protein
MEIGSELRALRGALNRALAMVDRLIEHVEPEKSEDHPVLSMPRTEAVEWVLARHDGPMRPTEILAELQRLGRDDSEVSVTAYDLWERGRIDRPGRGLYQARAAELN